MCSIWNAGDAVLCALDIADINSANIIPGGGRSASKQTKMQKQPTTLRPEPASKRAKMGWALSGKAKFITQLEAFEALVNRLYSLAPPVPASGNPFACNHAGSELRKDRIEGMRYSDDVWVTALTLCRRCRAGTPSRYQ
jgi:hypothetical protein